MQIDILTLFPTMFESVLGESMLKRAQDKGKLSVALHDLRNWTFDAHRSADDKPFGGGPGMVMKVEPVHLGLKEIGVLRKVKRTPNPEPRTPKSAIRVVLLTPQGKRFDQPAAKRLAKYKKLVLVCGHYEGFDERIRSFCDEELSIGDYVLTCGEIPAMVVVDAVARLQPGVLGDSTSLKHESFENDLLEYPQYTRPADYMGMKVPGVLVSGDHKKIEAWRTAEARQRTLERRPDLLKGSRPRGQGTRKFLDP